MLSKESLHFAKKLFFLSRSLKVRWTQQQADYQIAVIQSMLDDYYKKKEDGRTGNMKNGFISFCLFLANNIALYLCAFLRF
jgi:hypothetical protein